MPVRGAHAGRIAPALLAFALAAAVSACSGEANPIRDLAVASGVTGGEPKPRPDFISRSRPGSADYLPVGVSAPKRDYRPKTAEEVGSAEKELDRTRARNEAAAGRKVP